MWWVFTLAAAQPPPAHEAAGLRAIERLPPIDPPTLLLTHATVLPASGPRIDDGWLLLADGVIEAIGTGEPPERTGATVLDLQEKFVTPGLIDTHSHLGVYPSPDARAHGDGNEMVAPTTPGVWAEHSAWPQDPGFQRAIAGGITALQLLPGSANLIGGRGVVMQLVPARGSRAMRFPGAPETVKLACGENPKRVYGEKGGPQTRMGNIRGQRQAFLDALDYQRKWKDHAKDPSETKKKKNKKGDDGGDPPARDLDQETLVGILEGRVLPQIHCYRADDMLSMLQIADEFGFSIRSFHHAVEAYKIRDILAEQDVSVSTWADWWGFKLEAYDGIPHNAAAVAAAGGRAVIHSDSSVGIQRLNQEAAKAWHVGLRAGIELPEDEALRWITLNAAWTLGIEEQTGSLEVGKRADVVVWDAHPFSVYATAEKVFVEGVLRHEADDPTVWSDFQVGQGVE